MGVYLNACWFTGWSTRRNGASGRMDGLQGDGSKLFTIRNYPEVLFELVKKGKITERAERSG